MTTDAGAKPTSIFRALIRGTLILTGLVVGWFAAMASVMFATEVAPAALAIAPDAGLLTRIGDETSLLKGGRHVFVLTSDQPGYVRQLYGAGAWLVLPALRNGCLDLRAVSKFTGQPKPNPAE